MPESAHHSETTPLLVADVEAAAGKPLVPPLSVEEKMPWTALRIATHMLLWAVTAFVVGAFIKGVVDARGRGVEFDLRKALSSALGGGITGALAMVLQVLTLMPIRTIMNYQYRYGTSLSAATSTLYTPSVSSRKDSPDYNPADPAYNEGGFKRFYAGLGAALIQGPVSRFGDTAANVGVLVLLRGMDGLPSPVKTVFASGCAAAWRMVLTPVDTVKTTLQAEGGKRGWVVLRNRVRMYGIGTMWYGAFATAAATFVGNYPWFSTYNYLNEVLPLPTDDDPHKLLLTLLRAAFVGFCASVVSDTISNSLRVVKTYRQVNALKISYMDSACQVILVDGVRGLFGRGLKTRIVANGLQGIMFSVLWKIFLDLWNSKTNN